MQGFVVDIKQNLDIILNYCGDYAMENGYKKNFITNVIVRVDFPNPIPVHENLPPSLSKTILKFFPISEPKKLKGKTFTFNGDKITIEGEERTTEWNYFGKNREKHLVLTSESFSITQKKYESFEKLESEFIAIIEKCYECFSELQINRLGLRYINEIALLEQTDPFDWNNYLNDDLLAPFKVADDENKIARYLNNIVLNFEYFILNFRYGMHNPDFPTPIRKKIFVLDYDAHVTTLQDISDIKQNLDIFHDEIVKFFESHIKNGLRTIMHATS